MWYGETACTLHQLHFSPRVQPPRTAMACSKPLVDQVNGSNFSDLPSDDPYASASPRDDFGQAFDPADSESVIAMPTNSETHMGQASSNTFVETYEGCSEVFPGGKSFMDNFRQDKYAGERQENLYFPFASREEWQLASWLLRSHLSLSAIDLLLSLDVVHITSLHERERNLIIS